MAYPLIFLLYLVPPLVPTSHGTPKVLIEGDSRVSRGQDVTFTVLLACETGMTPAYNPFLDNSYYVPASVVILDEEGKVLKDLAASKNPAVLDTDPVRIPRTGSVGRAFLVPTGQVDGKTFSLPAGDYVVKATYFKSVLTGDMDSSEILCVSKSHEIVVHE